MWCLILPGGLLYDKGGSLHPGCHIHMPGAREYCCGRPYSQGDKRHHVGMDSANRFHACLFESNVLDKAGSFTDTVYQPAIPLSPFCVSVSPR